MPKPTNQQLLEAALKPFRGMGADEIAIRLKQSGLKGRPATTTCCPLALLLSTVHKGTYYIGQKYVMRKSGDQIAKAKTPPNLAIFQKRFDHMAYPFLLLPPPRVARHDYGTRRPASSRSKNPQKRRGFFFAKQVGRV